MSQSKKQFKNSPHDWVFLERLSQSDSDIRVDDVLFSDTGIEAYDNAKPQTKFRWLQKAEQFDGEKEIVSGRVGTTYKDKNGKIHLLVEGDESEYTDGYATLCHRPPNKLHIRASTHVDFSAQGICKHCLKQKQQLTAGKIVLEKMR